MKGEPVSKELREVFGQVTGGDQQIGAMEAAKEGIQAIAPGLSLRKIFGDIKDELKEQAKHGSHELAAALFNGAPFVMYGRGGRDDEPQPGLPEMQQETQKEQSRGGREL
jgi:hypothetical protein